MSSIIFWPSLAHQLKHKSEPSETITFVVAYSSLALCFFLATSILLPTIWALNLLQIIVPLQGCSKIIIGLCNPIWRSKGRLHIWNFPFACLGFHGPIQFVALNGTTHHFNVHACICTWWPVLFNPLVKFVELSIFWSNCLVGSEHQTIWWPCS